MKYNKVNNRLVKNYFNIPNEIFTMGLKGGEILVYSYLIYCEDRKTFECYPSFNRIGKAVGMAKNTVRKYVNSLIEKELIITEPTIVVLKSGRTQNGNLKYHIRPIDDAIKYNHEKQVREMQIQLARKRLLKNKIQNSDIIAV